jgi:hypothetical protein
VTSTTKRRSALTAGLLVVCAATIGSISACSYRSHIRDLAFDAVQIGDTEASVIEHFGEQPSLREKPEAPFSRYASQRCDGKCSERLWFENRISLDTEAWSVEMDANHRVIKKARWISP